jgi:uncharacterized protein YjdB
MKKNLLKTSLSTALLTMALTSGVPIAALAAETASNPQELEAIIQKHFQNRDTSFQFKYTGNVSNLKNDTRAAVDKVFEDNYLELAVKSWTYKASGTIGNVTMTFTNQYYTSAEQELYVTNRAQEILNQIITPGMDDHEKVKAIHDYIVSTVAYDQSHNPTSFSPYSALAYKTAVCQGYATLAYKMLTLAGVEAKIVIGTANGVNHSWNMVKIDGNWYHLDPTYDDPTPDKPGRISYKYYNLTTSQIWSNHNFDQSKYPSATTRYIDALNNTPNPQRYESIYNALGYSVPQGPVVVPVQNITITNGTNHTLNLTDKRSITLQVSVMPTDATDKTVVWRSENPSVATVNQSGVVTAVGAGTTQIIAESKDGNIKAFAYITVEEDQLPSVVPVSEIVFTSGQEYRLDLNGNESRRASIEIKPYNATDKTVIWSSNDPAIAKVDQSGLITAVSVGETMITVTSRDGKVVASAKVIVEQPQPQEIPVTRIDFVDGNYYKLDTVNNRNVQLNVQVNPSNASNKSVTWSSSNPNVATVDSRGYVTAIAPGEAVITVTSADGKISNSARVVVEEPKPQEIPVNSITFVGGTMYVLDTETNKTAQLRVEINPSDATNKSVRWSSSNPNVAKVDDNGFVTAIAPGQTTITVASVDGKVSASATVRVDKVEKTIKVQDIKFPATIYRMNKKENNLLELNPQLFPLNATDKTLVWKSTNPSVATVDENGTVTAVAGGSTRIIVSSVDGGVTETVYVEVENNEVIPVSDIKFPQRVYNLDLETTKTLQLNPTVLPDNATIKTLTWKSSNPAVATVDSNGLVTILGTGATSIIATSADGQVTESVRVVVEAKARVTDIKFLEDRKGVTLSLAATKTYQLKYIVLPDYAPDKTLKWESTNPAIAEVDSNGMLTLKAPGNVMIRATSADGLTMEGIRVTVNP